MKVLAVIPARAGSKRVKNKNIKLLNGQPLIAYTIQVAKKSQKIDRIIVSTDSNQIAIISEKYGAEVPFLRPSEISQDNSKEIEFLNHTLEWLKSNENLEPDLIVILYPTSPFRKAESIDSALMEIINQPKAHSLRSVRLCSEHPYKMWTISNKKLLPFVDKKDPNTHTLSYHLLPEVFIQNASIYITRPSTIRNTKSYIGTSVIPFVMDEFESLDVNSELDFKMAEQMMIELERENKDAKS